MTIGINPLDRRQLLKGSLFGTALFSAGLLFSGCSNSGSKSSGAASGQSLSVALVASISGAVVMVGNQKGWYKDANLTVTPKVFGSGKGSEAMQSLGGRSAVDVALVGATPMINSAAHGGIPLKVISVINDTTGAFALFARQGIKTVADLKGKKVAFAKGSTYDFFLRKALTKAGLGIADIQPVYLSASDAVTAFVGKHVDAVVPETSEIDIVKEKATDATIIFKGSDFDPSDAFRVVNPIVTTETALNSKRDALKALLAVYHGKVVPYYQADQTHDDAVQFVAKGISSEGGGSVDAVAIGKTMATQEFYNSTQIPDLMKGDTLVKSLQSEAQFLKDTGGIDKVPDLGDLVDASLLPTS